MENKIMHSIIVYMQERNVEICPSEDFDGIVINIKNDDDDALKDSLYLDEQEMEFLIAKMKEVMVYVKS